MPAIDAHRPALQALLTNHRPFNEAEAAHRERLLDFLRRSPAPFDRATVEGHVTGSAVLTDAESQYVLLIWHQKLKRWLQPGGHCEPDDADTASAALRELVEETGLSPDEVTLADAAPFDVDVHLFPAREGQPAHFHHDVRYLFRLRGPGTPRASGGDEANETRWMPVEELAALPDESMSRLGRRLLARGGESTQREE